MSDFVTPDYAASGLAGVLPAVARSLGVGDVGEGLLDLPEARGAVVVLLDGLGEELLRRRGGHAPYLRGLLPTSHRLTSGFPSTTATSMGTFGTGLPPGAHGLVGYEVLMPDRDAVFNELSWEHGPDPLTWQPADTVFQRAEAAGISVTRIGPGFFDGSGLTRAALRGGRFRAASSLEARVDATVSALRASPRPLVYLYWGDIDKIGHEFGCESWQWGRELEAVDAELRRLARSLPAGIAMYVTADHGMVDIPHDKRIDLALRPDLTDGVRHVGGEARAVQLYCRPGAVDDVVATWQAEVGEHATIHTRAQVEDLGWFGPVGADVRMRIGDVVAAMHDEFAVVDSRTQRPQLLRLFGLHGSLTPAEIYVPLLSEPPR